mmetsp:Transcript_36527/g.86732  ORF Transcript_36527/g.86732 Transcript_36527/m.86732 type:complete len:188 (-) Transcript_36527:1203-1766(-)
MPPPNAVQSTRRLPDLHVLRCLFEYDPEEGTFTWKEPGPRRRVGALAGGRDSGGYVKLSVLGRCYKAHRIAYYMGTGVDPMGHEIDHIDGKVTNNRLANLRLATHQENHQNLNVSKVNRTGYTGVSWHSRIGKFQSRIHRAGRDYHLGYYNTILEAAAAYEGAAIMHRGQWHRQRHLGGGGVAAAAV